MNANLLYKRLYHYMGSLFPCILLLFNSAQSKGINYSIISLHRKAFQLGKPLISVDSFVCVFAAGEEHSCIRGGIFLVMCFVQINVDLSKMQIYSLYIIFTRLLSDTSKSSSLDGLWYSTSGLLVFYKKNLCRKTRLKCWSERHKIKLLPKEIF